MTKETAIMKILNLQVKKNISKITKFSVFNLLHLRKYIQTKSKCFVLYDCVTDLLAY